jgi:hypothetical protein
MLGAACTMHLVDVRGSWAQHFARSVWLPGCRLPPVLHVFTAACAAACPAAAWPHQQAEQQRPCWLLPAQLLMYHLQHRGLVLGCYSTAAHQSGQVVAVGVLELLGQHCGTVHMAGAAAGQPGGYLSVQHNILHEANTEQLTTLCGRM